MPRCARESAVMFSRKWMVALGLGVFVFSTIETEVSSLLDKGIWLAWSLSMRLCGMRGGE